MLSLLLRSEKVRLRTQPFGLQVQGQRGVHLGPEVVQLPGTCLWISKIKIRNKL